MCSGVCVEVLFMGFCVVLQFHWFPTLPPLTKLLHCPRQWQWAFLVRCFIIVLMHDLVCMLCLYLWYKHLDGCMSISAPSPWGWRVVLWCDLILDDLLCHDTSILVQVNRFLMTLGTSSLKKWMQHLLYIPLNMRAWFLMVFYSKSQLLAVGQSKMRSYMHTWREHVPKNRSLVTFCHKVIAVRGNPRMKAFGEDMLSKLEGKSATHACVLRCVHMGVHVCPITWPKPLLRFGSYDQTDLSNYSFTG